MATVLAGLAGCGGDGGGTPSGGTLVPISGGISTLAKRDTPAVPATTTDEGVPTTYTTTIGGVSKTVYIAATSTATPAGTPIAVFPDLTPILSGSLTDTRAPGDIFMTCFGQNGAKDIKTKFSNIVSTQNGKLVLTKPLGLLPGQYYGSVEGPLYFGDGGGRLTVGAIGFMFEVKDDGSCSFPTRITGNMPANGGHTGVAGMAVTTTCDVKFAGGATGLIVGTNDGSYIEGGFMDLTAKYTFRSTNKGFAIPGDGVTSVQFSSYGPTQ